MAKRRDDSSLLLHRRFVTASLPGNTPCTGSSSTIKHAEPPHSPSPPPSSVSPAAHTSTPTTVQAAAAPSFAACLLGGAVAGTAVDMSLFPLDTIKTRAHLPGGLWKNGGFAGVYRGFAVATAASAPCAAVFFGTYELIKSRLSQHPFLLARPPQQQQRWDTAVYMVAASCAEVTAAVVRMPFETIKQLRQANLHASNSAALRHVLRTRGVRGLFKGYTSLVAREIPFSFLQLPLYEWLKRASASAFGHPGPHDLPGLQVALCGSLAGGLAAALTTPLDVVKTRVVVLDKPQHILRTLGTLYREGGLRTLFAGIVPRVTWISVGGAIFFGAYEQSRAAFAANGI